MARNGKWTLLLPQMFFLLLILLLSSTHQNTERPQIDTAGRYVQTPRPQNKLQTNFYNVKTI